MASQPVQGLIEGEKETFEKIEGLLNAYKSSRVLSAALELELFEKLFKNGSPMTAKELGEAAKVHSSKNLDPLLDVLVVHGFLRRSEGSDKTFRYECTPASARLLGDPNSDTFFIMWAKMSTEWDNWARLPEMLRTGNAVGPGYRFQHFHKDGGQEDGHKDGGDQAHHHGQHHHQHHEGQHHQHDHGRTTEKDKPLHAHGTDIPKDWTAIYKMMEKFMRLSYTVLAKRFDFSRYTHVLDVGGGNGQLSRMLARQYKNLRCTNFELPGAEQHARKRMEEVGTDVADRVTLVSGDALKDDLPKCDVIHIGNVMHHFTTEQRKLFIQRAHDTLSPGGALIISDKDMVDSSRTYLIPQLEMISMQLTGMDAEETVLREEKVEEFCREAGFLPGLEKIVLSGMMHVRVAYKKEH